MAPREFWIGKLHHGLDEMENARGLGVRLSDNEVLREQNQTRIRATNNYQLSTNN